MPIIHGRMPTETQHLMYRMADLQPDALARLRTALHDWKRGVNPTENAAVVQKLIFTDDLERAYLAFSTVTGIRP